MVYLVYLFFTMVFIYNTPLFDMLIAFIKKKPLILKIFSIYGDVLYMIGGGVIAGVIINTGPDNFTFWSIFNNYGILLIITGATIREYFKQKG